MKLALGIENEMVSDFFGSCNMFTLVDIENGQVVSKETIFNDTQTHKQRPAYLKSLGIDALVFNGMGLTAYDLLTEQGIVLYQAPGMSVEAAIEAFIQDKLARLDIPGGSHC